jgi:type II secretory pathway pseudopilin PulG
MKLTTLFSSSNGRRSSVLNQGFSLLELLVAFAIFMLLVTGIIAANLFGLRMFQLNVNKLTATNWGRQTIESLTDQIHACSSVQIGNYDSVGFTGLLDGETQQGNALIIYPTANPTNFFMYYINLGNQTFLRTDQAGNTLKLADSVTNTIPFSAQNFSGMVLTNTGQPNQVIHLALEFYRPESFLQRADYFKLETSVIQRVVP